MTRLVSMLVAASFMFSLGCARLRGAPEPKTEEQKTLYSLGLMLGRNISVFNLTTDELELVKAGLSDSVLKRKPAVDLSIYGPKLNALATSRSAAAAVGEKAKSKGALEAAAREPGAVQTPSGLVYRSIKPGTGPTPGAADRVKVNYEGTLTDGSVFDSSIARKEPATFPLNGVIKCWSEGVQRMKVGEKAKLTCPSDLAYGEKGSPPTIPGSATLTFEVELLEILK